MIAVLYLNENFFIAPTRDIQLIRHRRTQHNVAQGTNAGKISFVSLRIILNW